MKRNHYLIILFLIGTSLTSCKKSDIAYDNDFDKSYKSWLSFKKSSNNSYRYKTAFGSWTGSSAETIITVKDGKVVQRSYVAKARLNPSSNEFGIYEKWDEDVNGINTHTSGASTLTLDEIYQKAKTDWLLKRKTAKTSLETNNNGMISSCGYVEDGCQDDCFRGIYIEFIEKV